MRRFVLLGMALLGSVLLALAWVPVGERMPDAGSRAGTEAAPAAAGLGRLQAGTLGFAGPTAGGAGKAGAASRHPEPPAASSPAPPYTPAVSDRRAHHRLRRQQVQQILAARQRAGVSAPAASDRGLPPEERAAMEAAGLDWRRVEELLAGTNAGAGNPAGEAMLP